MKRELFTIFFCLFLFTFVNAQTSEKISELEPVPYNIGKFSKKLPVDKNRVIKKDNFKFKVKTEYVNLSNNRKGIVVIIQTTYNELVYLPTGEQQTARLNIYGRITAKNKVIDGFFEERLQVNLDNVDDKIDFEEIANTPVILRKVFELPIGKYQVGIIVRDFTSGERGVKLVKFEIP